MEASGLDTEGREFKNAREMWSQEIGDGEDQLTEKKKEWYSKGVSYWQGIEASVDGVLGGYGHVSAADVQGSEEFLKELLSEQISGRDHLVALDCGSGIGRVTKELLLRYFNEVDLVEPVSHLLEAARESLNSISELDAPVKSLKFYCVPLQGFSPDFGRYDVIWVQWCIGQLADDDLVSFFKRAKAGLKHNGVLVVKENTARNGFVLDNEDKSITRSDPYFKELFSQSGLHLYKVKDQKGFPAELFPVRMYALIGEDPKKLISKKRKQSNRPVVIR